MLSLIHIASLCETDSRLRVGHTRIAKLPSIINCSFMLPRALIIISVVVIMTVPVYAQVSSRQTLDLQSGCAFAGEMMRGSITVKPASRGALEAVRAIAAYSGVPSRFAIYSMQGFNNAVAAIVEGQRVILYDPDLIHAIQNHTSGYWSSISILAHEVGHHLAGHTLPRGGAGYQAELEADYFSGFVMYKLGASLDNAQRAYRTFASITGSSTHPARAQRLQAVENGWRSAAALRDHAATPPTPPDIESVHGFYPIIFTRYLYPNGEGPEGCYHDPEFNTMTVYSVEREDYPEFVYRLEDASGERYAYYLDASDLNMALLSWVPEIMRPGRRVKVQISMCGAAGRFQYLRYVEPLKVGAR